MLYVFDTNVFIVAGHYFPSRFPSLWAHIEGLVEAGRLVSVSEVKKELENNSTRSHISAWVTRHENLFNTPSSAEMAFVARVFAVPEFQALVKLKDRLSGSPVADPFVIARAAVLGGCVVTEEHPRPGAVRIPTVCDHFGIPCRDVDGLMGEEGWSF